MSFVKTSCEEFVEKLSTKAPVPGGGGASALVGAIGTALGGMVGSLTIGKKKYAAVQEDILRLKEKSEELQKKLLLLVERDAEVFEPLSKAYGLPSNTEQERAEKTKIMEQTLKEASQVPLEIMQICCEAIVLLEEFAEKGSAIAISDAGVGAVCCKAALKGAGLNVLINTNAMKDRDFAEKTEQEMNRLLSVYESKADQVYEKVVKRIQKK